MPSYFVGFSCWFIYNTFIFCRFLLLVCLQYFHQFYGLLVTLILNVVFVGALMVSHESDQVDVPLNHAMEDANWVHEGSRWKCKINGCTNTYATKWLLHQHLDNKHKLCMEVGKYGRPSICVRGPRQQNHRAMNIQILSNPHARQK
jgi:hypothetical protein